MRTMKKVAAWRSHPKGKIRSADKSSKEVLTISVLQKTSLAQVKEQLPQNRAIQSISSEEYDEYIKRLIQASKLLAIVD